MLEDEEAVNRLDVSDLELVLSVIAMGYRDMSRRRWSQSSPMENDLSSTKGLARAISRLRKTRHPTWFV